MLIARALLVVTLLASFASAESYLHTLLARKPREVATEYFELCHYVNIWKEQLGHVSVLVFLNPLWQYNVRQAVLLKLLGVRLRKSGFSDIRCFVVTPQPDFAEDTIDEDLELQTWSEISMLEPENLTLASQHILKDDGEGWKMTVIQDSPQLRLWQRFRASNNQIAVIDRCGKLTYQVMMPWSILYFPYVKAAILSTYQENPCGACDESQNKEYLSNTTNSNENPPRSDGVKDDLVQNGPENTGLRFTESLGSGYEASTVSTFRETSDGTTYLGSSSVTEAPARSESTYQYDSGTTESSLDESNTNVRRTEHQSVLTDVEENMRNLENNSEMDGGTTPFDSQQYVLPKGEDSSTLISTVSPDVVNYESETEDILPEKSPDEIEYNSIANVVIETSPLPLRIIMYAPHIHKNRKDTKKHTHLILKTDSSNYHGHLDETKVAALPINLSQYSEEYGRKTEPKFEIDAHGEDTNQKYAYDRDERPGLYGEAADYWMNYEEKDDDITDRNETSNNNYNYTDIVTSDGVVTYKVDNTNYQVTEEEEVRNKLLEHYNKLLPWIHFILNN